MEVGACDKNRRKEQELLRGAWDGVVRGGQVCSSLPIHPTLIHSSISPVSFIMHLKALLPED
jgi:hypothetical protein